MDSRLWLMLCWLVVLAGCEVQPPSNSIAAPSSPEGSGQAAATSASGIPQTTAPDKAAKPDGTAPQHPTPTFEPPPVEPSGPKKAIPIPAAAPETLHQPTVVMSQAHQQTCRVKVGDRMPELTLPDLSGQPRTLPSLYGDRLTVVVFWNSRYVFALEQYLRLQKEVVEPFSQFGVATVAINVADDPKTVAAIAERAGTTVPCLLDQRGEAMAQVATAKLPRTYLLDAEGKILWLDIEYSLSTARELRNAVHYYLQQLGGAEGPTAIGRFQRRPGGSMAQWREGDNQLGG